MLFPFHVQDEKNGTHAVSLSFANNVELKSESSKIPVVSIANAAGPVTRALPSESTDLLEVSFLRSGNIVILAKFSLTYVHLV